MSLTPYKQRTWWQRFLYGNNQDTQTKQEKIDYTIAFIKSTHKSQYAYKIHRMVYPSDYQRRNLDMDLVKTEFLYAEVQNRMNLTKTADWYAFVMVINPRMGGLRAVIKGVFTSKDSFAYDKTEYITESDVNLDHELTGYMRGKNYI